MVSSLVDLGDYRRGTDATSRINKERGFSARRGVTGMAQGVNLGDQTTAHILAILRESERLWI